MCFHPGRVKIYIQTFCNLKLLRTNHCPTKFPIYSSWEYWRCPLAQVQSLLDYCLQLSSVSANVLKPLIVLEGCYISQDYPKFNHVSLFVREPRILLDIA